MMWAVQDFTPTEANVSSASSTLLVLIIGDNKLAHIKLPAMAAGGAGGNSGQDLLLQGGAAGGRLRGQDVAGAALLRVQIQRQTHHNSTGRTRVSR